ncbi:MAG: glycosyltransferase family 4 protein [Gammaproteobacteria bacterium]|nr:glycosyltransferase family 4 protein [Gammaproteobacteria bacterium]
MRGDELSLVKILFSHRTASRDGQAVHIEELVAAFRRQGHEIIMVGPANTDKKEFGEGSSLLELSRRYLPGAILEVMEYAYSFLAFYQLRKAFLKYQPDVIYERYNLFFMAGVWLKRIYDIPLFLEVNAPIYEERCRYDGITLKGFAESSQKNVWAAADRVLPVSHVLAEYVADAGISPDKITVIPNGINSEQFLAPIDKTASKEVFGAQNKIVVGFTGFIREWHGLEQVIDWLAVPGQSSNVQLILVGDGPAREALELRAEKAGIGDRVLFTGLIGREAIPETVAAFDIALQSGVTDYASPLKLIEYMALGCAIVAPDQPNIRELLKDGETALLFEPSSPESMRSKMERLCADKVYRENIGNAARASVLANNLTWDENAKHIVKLYKRALAVSA